MVLFFDLSRDSLQTLSKIHGEITVPESLFNKATGWEM